MHFHDSIHQPSGTHLCLPIRIHSIPVVTHCTLSSAEPESEMGTPRRAMEIGIIQTDAISFETPFLDRGLLVQSTDEISMRERNEYDVRIPYVQFARAHVRGLELSGAGPNPNEPPAVVWLNYYAYFWTLVDQLSNILQTANRAIKLDISQQRRPETTPRTMGWESRPKWDKMGITMGQIVPNPDAKGLLRLSAIGNGSAARWKHNDNVFDIGPFVEEMVVNALYCALTMTPKLEESEELTKFAPAPCFEYIERIQLCNFDHGRFSTDFIWRDWPVSMFRPSNRHIVIDTLENHDLLDFDESTIQNHRCMVVNAQDTFGMPGHSWEDPSENAMVGDRTTLRLTQSYFTNPRLLMHEGPHFYSTMSPLVEWWKCCNELQEPSTPLHRFTRLEALVASLDDVVTGNVQSSFGRVRSLHATV